MNDLSANDDEIESSESKRILTKAGSKATAKNAIATLSKLKLAKDAPDKSSD